MNKKQLPSKATKNQQHLPICNLGSTLFYNQPPSGLPKIVSHAIILQERNQNNYGLRLRITFLKKNEDTIFYCRNNFKRILIKQNSSKLRDCISFYM